MDYFHKQPCILIDLTIIKKPSSSIKIVLQLDMQIIAQLLLLFRVKYRIMPSKIIVTT